MEQESIIKIITQLFAGADEKDLPKVESTMDEIVLLDYTSMTGGEPAQLSPAQITGAWAAFLPGFDSTHHQLGDFEVKENNGIANVHYYGKAQHFIGKNEWVVEGDYDTELQKKNSAWKITKHKFKLSRQSGDTGLPAVAREKAGNKT